MSLAYGASIIQIPTPFKGNLPWKSYKKCLSLLHYVLYSNYSAKKVIKISILKQMQIKKCFPLKLQLSH